MQVAILGEDFKDLARLVSEERVVWNDDGGPPTLFQNRHHMLNKVQLLIAGLDGEVFSVRGLICTFYTERRIRKHDIEAPAVRNFVDGVAELDFRLKSVEIKVH